jgi:transcription elongation factor GreB
MIQQEKNYITPKGLVKLQEELNHLLKVERPEVVKIVSWAASLGDRSENADYKYGKKRLREIDSRTKFLLDRINAAVVVEPARLKSAKVQFGATVMVEDDAGKLKCFSIVGVDESDAAEGLVSWKSPVGTALLGKEVGDEVVVKTPAKKINYTITDIKYIDIKVGD